MKTKFIYSIVLSFVFFISYSFIESQSEKGVEIQSNTQFKNLKVLPKDISEEELKAVMHNFNDALGVKCSFCHASGSNGKLDFASDGKKYKEVAREMMKMTMGINKKYFKTKNPREFEVTCYTCHNGNDHPSKYPTQKEDH